MRILNARLREIERRLLAAENDQAGRVTEAEQRDLIQRAKLAVFMVFARMEMKSGRGEAAADVETVLAVLPPDLGRVMREQIERGKPDSSRDDSEAIRPFLPISGEALLAVDAYLVRHSARWRSRCAMGPPS
jgi:hypothetical protein